MGEKLILELDHFQAKLLQVVIAHGRSHLSDVKELDEIVDKLEEFTQSSSWVFIIKQR